MKRRLLRGAGGIALAAHLLGAPGCIPVVPFYRSDTFWQWPRGDPMRQNVEKVTETGFPRVDVARREDVLARLGEPDQSSEDQKEFVYRWRKVIGVIPGCSGMSSDIKETYLLRVRFDDAGIVRHFDYP